MQLLIDYGYKTEPLTAAKLEKHFSIYQWITLVINGVSFDVENKSFNKALNITFLK